MGSVYQVLVDLVAEYLSSTELVFKDSLVEVPLLVLLTSSWNLMIQIDLSISV